MCYILYKIYGKYRYNWQILIFVTVCLLYLYTRNKLENDNCEIVYIFIKHILDVNSNFKWNCRNIFLQFIYKYI